MAKNKRTLIKNSLNDLVKKFSENDVIARMEKEYQSQGGNNIPLSLIDDNSFVKKVKFSQNSIERISTGILERGLYNPLVVRPSGAHYELILGRKRYFGAKKARLSEVPCVIVEAGDEETLLMLLADNRDQREANAVEMALLYKALSERFSYSQSTLASLSHQSRSQVTNIMRLLSLPEKVLMEVSDGSLSYGHARAILSLSDEEIEKIVARIHEEKLSVRETEELSRQYIAHLPSPSPTLVEELKSVSKAKSVIVRRSSIIFEFENDEKKDCFIQNFLNQKNKK